MLEAEVQSKGRKRAKAAGWLNIRISKALVRGTCDDWFGKNGRSVFVEWKSPKLVSARRKTALARRQQEKRHEELRDQGFEVYLLWDDDDLMEMLEGNRGL